jgi:hypothetical protein
VAFVFNTLVGFEVLTLVVMNNFVFSDITPCSPLKVNPRFGGTCRLYLYGRRISLARNQHETGSNQTYLEAKCSSETSDDFQRTTWRYIPEDRTL